MTFSRRLTLYLFGFLIGLALVFAFFGDRLNIFSDWFPNNRVLLILRDDEIEISPHAQCQMDCLGLHQTAIDLALENGDVDFSASDPQADPRVYAVDISPDDGREYRFVFEAEETISTIVEATLLNEKSTCDCN